MIATYFTRIIFFKGKFNNELLELASEKRINLFISDVVIEELRRQYEVMITEKNKQIKELLKDKDRHRLLTIPNLDLINSQFQLQVFDEFYQELESKKNIVKLPYDNNFLPELVNRAVNRKMPFRENKSEFKDAVIWLTYSKYVESNNLVECVLLTNNTSDFCAKKEKEKVHPDLERDTQRFKIYNSSNSLLKSENEKLNIVPRGFSQWISLLNIDEYFVFELIKENFQSEIEKFILDEIDNKELYELFDVDVFERWLSGYISSNYSEIFSCSEIEVTIINDKAIISGIVNGYCDYDGYEYNPVRDSGEDSNSYLSDGSVEVSVHFSFKYDKNEIPNELELENIKLGDFL